MKNIIIKGFNELQLHDSNPGWLSHEPTQLTIGQQRQSRLVKYWRAQLRPMAPGIHWYWSVESGKKVSQYFKLRVQVLLKDLSFYLNLRSHVRPSRARQRHQWWRHSPRGDRDVDGDVDSVDRDVIGGVDSRWRHQSDHQVSFKASGWA